ncbi:MAG: FAD/NAD(P)-binding protein [Candidatus Methanoperedens sp.]|nr:FAD/NAD(P)-binding protein [Candidatus Methanoperedens sp.]MCE8428775.1 FAD/NAD(P)-binding protein [Candidatus Methanoperedens sp.]
MEKIILKDSAYGIKKGTILGIQEMTENEKLFEIALEGGQKLDHEPGQFVMVSVFGAGEIPISVSSSPTNNGSFEICVRAAGKVTNALHKLEIGDMIGIRGPYGKGFPIRILERNDLLIIACGLGIAPLRSLIRYVFDNRKDFGNVHILYGCRSPDNMLFLDEIKEWKKQKDVYFECIVDQATPDWTGKVGIITTLIPGVRIDPERTFTALVGPPAMYKPAIQELLSMNVPESQILISLERHMKCGVGMCGHCQIQNLYCCQDGPVFNYEAIKHLKEAF